MHTIVSVSLRKEGEKENTVKTGLVFAFCSVPEKLKTKKKE